MAASGSRSPTAPTAASTPSTPTTCWAATAPTASCAPQIGSTMRDLNFEQRWLVVDVATDADLDQWEGVHQVCDPRRARHLHAHRRQPATAGSFGCCPARPPTTSRAWPRSTRSSRRGPRDVADDELELVRVTEYTFRAQIADRWRRGNVFLLGDAAHLTPPFIGQGMGAGLRDAMNLSWKLAGVLAGDLPRGRSGQLRAGAQTARPRHDPARAHRRPVDDRRAASSETWYAASSCRRCTTSPACAPRSSTATTPALRRSALVHRSRRQRRLAGTLCPNPVLADGRRLDETLGIGFALVSAVPVSAEQRARLEQRGAAVHIAGAGTDLAEWLRHGHAAAAVVRPDRTVMRAGSQVDELCAAVPTFRADGGDK